ncbi:F-box only protein 6-like [Rutidosis leptorrhynchoides]|uniref:F-box only protein 6-like n=1 Tax=Rutidosis leptorrhynchoides TaxID=125765 RepID=UPI003A9991A2
MFRHFIDQVQDLVDRHGFPPPPPPVTTVPPLHDRWCFLNLENDLSKDGCYDLIMKTKKSKLRETPSKKTQKDQKHTENPNSNESMDEIWKHFPEDLYESVIARLPVATFFRFRSVCQNWNSLLHSNNFTLQCTQPSQPWFYTITHENVNSGAMYDPVSKKWHHPIVPKIPTKMIILPVASAGGLLCFLDIGHRSFYVCNPLTSSFKQLPARSAKIWSRVSVGMILNENSTNYKIIWVATNGEYEIYDSIVNSWTHMESIPDCIGLPLSLNYGLQILSANGLMYFLRLDPDGIVSFDMDKRVWNQYLVPVPPHSRDHSLAECDGRMMLVGLVTKNAATCVSIWELQKMTLLWKEVDRMPNVMCLEFYGKHVKLSCLGNKGLIMLSIESKMMNRLVTYEISKKEWLKVPGCVPPHKRKQMWIACGTTFHPSLTAIA